MAESWDAREEGGALLAAVVAAIADERVKAGRAGRVATNADLARAVLRSPALQDANRRNLDAMVAGKMPEVAARVVAEAAPIAEAAATAERERIAQLAETWHVEVYVDDDGSEIAVAVSFADLIRKGTGHG